MPTLFLIPIISIFDAHDVAVRDWLNKLDAEALSSHLEFPFRLDRFFPESTRHALKSVEEVHGEVLRLLDIIDPQAVLLDIPVDFVGLENKYNKRLLSSLGFWSEYYQVSANSSDSHRAIYRIYIKEIIDKNIRLIESKEHLPLSVVFYGLDIKTREELVPVYEDALDKDSEFVLQAARAINEIANLRESPKHLWYSSMAQRQTAISYEETEKFYSELISRLERLLKFKVREHFVRNLREKAAYFVSAYENFLEHKMREDEIKISNIMKGLEVLLSQSEDSAIVVFCGPMNYHALFLALKKEKKLFELGITLGEVDITSLLNKMKPFTQKNRIMQSNYEIALDILGRKKPRRFDVLEAVLIPA